MVAFDTFFLVAINLIPCITPMPSVMQVPEIRLTKECYNRGYCFEKHEKYPQDLIDKLVQGMNMTHENSMIFPPRALLFEENDCDRNIVMNEIYEIVDKNDNVRIVVQSEGYIKQLLEVEECINPGPISKPSIHFNTDIVNNFDLHCLQTHLDVTFLVLNMNWTGLELVKTKRDIPVACNCVVLDK